MEKEKRITPRQKRAIEALLSQPNITAAAKAAGINRTTIYKWLKDNPAFKDALNNATTLALNSLYVGLLGLSTDAAKVLGEIIQDNGISPATRVNAINTYLNNLLRMGEQVNVDQRINSLEVTIKQQGNEYAG